MAPGLPAPSGAALRAACGRLESPRLLPRFRLSLPAAEELMTTKSFHSVGLNEILSAVKVPKGSFYHYFESKDQFGVELVKHYVADASSWKRRMLLSEDLDSNPLERLSSYMNGAI